MKKKPKTIAQHIADRITRNRERIASQFEMDARRAELEILAPTREKQRLARENQA